MLSEIYSSGLYGIDGFIVTVEADGQPRMANFELVGLPDAAVTRALEGRDFPGKVVLVAAGKAAWQMADAAVGCLGDRIHSGIGNTVVGSCPRTAHL